MEDKNKRELVIIELMRGVFAFGVVAIHASKTLLVNPIENLIVNSFFNLAVPFFLITSLYFSIGAARRESFKYFLSKKLDRLVLPYLVWSLIYFLVRLPGGKIALTFDSIVGSIFLGWSAVQLYFVPLLLIGTILLYVIANHKYFNKTFNLVTGLIVSLFSGLILESTGNSYVLGRNSAFASLLENLEISVLNELIIIRIFLSYLAWLISISSYVFLALLVQKKLNQILGFLSYLSSKFYFLFLISSFVFLTLFPHPWSGLFLGTFIFVMSHSISYNINLSQDIKSYFLIFGKNSFSIYLSHHLITEGLEKLIPDIFIEKTDLLFGVLVILVVTYRVTAILRQKLPPMLASVLLP